MAQIIETANPGYLILAIASINATNRVKTIIKFIISDLLYYADRSYNETHSHRINFDNIKHCRAGRINLFVYALDR